MSLSVFPIMRSNEKRRNRYEQKEDRDFGGD
jgi:hypothetical protein